MEEREKLMLYHGIMIGTMASGSLPPPWAAPWIKEVAAEFDDAKRNAVATEVKEEIIQAAMRLRGAEN